MASVSHAIENISKLYNKLSGSYNISSTQLFRYDDIINPTSKENPSQLMKYLEFVDVERFLSDAKTALDPIDASYFELVDMFSFLKDFYENRKNAQLVTSSWLNFSEIFNKYNIIDKDEEINVFFSVELPDSSISALNHYCKTHSIKLNWLAANSASLNLDGSIGNISDKDGIYEKYPDNWIGVKRHNMNGDFTNMDNLNTIQKHVLSQYKNGVDLYISNIGVNNFTDINNLEVIYSNIYFGHILNGLCILKRGGNMCVKQYTFLKPLTISIIILLSNLFKTIEFVTTSSSNCLTSEVYLVCKGFYGATDTLKAKLIDLFKSYIQIKDNTVSSLLPFYELNTNTNQVVNDLKDISKAVFQDIYSNIIRYITIILLSIDPSNLESSKKALKNELLKYRIELEDNYIRTNNIRKLEQKYMLTTKKDQVSTNVETLFSYHIIQMAGLYNSSLNYRDIVIVEESKFSSLRPDHMSSVRSFYTDNISFSKSQPFNIIDGTSNVGVDSMFLASIFNSENVSIVSVEINVDTYKVLEKNLANISNIIYDTPYIGKIKAVNMDIVKYIIETSDLQNTDILYLDPPWGGHSYIGNSSIELSLGKMSLSKLVAISILKKIKNIVCKVPKNINVAKFIDDVYNHIIIEDPIKQMVPIPSQSELYTANKFDVSTGIDVSYFIIYFSNRYSVDF
jgi:hypothetical protein